MPVTPSGDAVRGPVMRGVVLRAFVGRRAWRAAIASGVAFGLLHLVVRAWGRPLGEVLPLVVVTSLLGIGHACVRLRTGTVWAPLALHALFDVLQDAGSAGAVLGQGPATAVLLACGHLSALRTVAAARWPHPRPLIDASPGQAGWVHLIERWPQ
ncbi:CPBP family intramembrane glutamic endopeptidase [Geodermatophilus sp. SYSU D00079]